MKAHVYEYLEDLVKRIVAGERMNMAPGIIEKLHYSFILLPHLAAALRRFLIPILMSLCKISLTISLKNLPFCLDTLYFSAIQFRM